MSFFYKFCFTIIHSDALLNVFDVSVKNRPFNFPAVPLQKVYLHAKPAVNMALRGVFIYWSRL